MGVFCMTASELSEDQLVELAATGDVSAVKALLEQHRERLIHMVTIRMDPRVAKRGRVAMGRCRPTAPTDPDVRSLGSEPQVK